MNRLNPFFHRGPIRDPVMFHGRRTEVAQALALLGQGQSLSIVGPRRMGKTSLLLHITNPSVPSAAATSHACSTPPMHWPTPWDTEPARTRRPTSP